MLRRGVLALIVSLLAATACDSRPSGPGTLVAVVQGPSLGGALLEIEGAGIESFAGLGGTQLYDATVAGAENAYRVLLLHPTSGEMRFEIHVQDVRMPDPAMTVLSATGVDNLERLTAGIEARIER